MKGYTIIKLNDIELLTRILRASPQISWEDSKSINKLNLKAVNAITSYQEEAKLLQERYEAAKEDEAAKELIKAELYKLNTKEYEVEAPLKIQVNGLVGDKEYNTQEGVKIFSYKEAYFGLLNLDLIVD